MDADLVEVARALRVLRSVVYEALDRAVANGFETQMMMGDPDSTASDLLDRDASFDGWDGIDQSVIAALIVDWQQTRLGTLPPPWHGVVPESVEISYQRVDGGSDVPDGWDEVLEKAGEQYGALLVTLQAYFEISVISAVRAVALVAHAQHRGVL